MSAKKTYENEMINNVEWVKDIGNIDNSGNVSDVIGIDKNNLEDEMINNCSGMNLGDVGMMDIENKAKFLNNSNLQKVLEYYKKKSPEYPKNDENSDNYDTDSAIYKSEDKYYKNIHPLKECKEDSYKFLKKLCNSYSLPDHTDPAYMVMPRKCNLQGLVGLLDVCSVRNNPRSVNGTKCKDLSTEGENSECEKNKNCIIKNKQEGEKIISKECINYPGSESTEKGINNYLQRILPYDENLGENKGYGLCNNVKMDTMGVDGTIDIWQKMWNEHNESLNEIGNITKKFIENETGVLKKTLNLRRFYEDNLNSLNDINEKKTCYLLGKEYLGKNQEAADKNGCGKQLSLLTNNFLVSRSIPICIFEKSKIHGREKKIQRYIMITAIILGFLFFMYMGIMRKNN